MFLKRLQVPGGRINNMTFPRFSEARAPSMTVFINHERKSYHQRRSDTAKIFHQCILPLFFPFKKSRFSILVPFSKGIVFGYTPFLDIWIWEHICLQFFLRVSCFSNVLILFRDVTLKTYNFIENWVNIKNYIHQYHSSTSG